MYKQPVSNKFRRKGKKPPRRGGVIGSQSLQVNHAYLEKSRFPQLPREYEVALCYNYHDERTGGQTTQAARVTPLTEFNTQLPRWCAELYQIYRHARIMAIDVHMEVVNTSSTVPLIATVGCLPLVNANAVTDPKTLISVPGSVVKQIGLATGMSRAVLSRRFITERELGELTIGSQTYLQTYSEALSSAVWTELPAIYTGVIAAVTGGNWVGVIDYKLTYHIRFSEYSIPALGFKKLTRYMEDDRESEMDDCEWVQPPLVRVKKRDPSTTSKVTK